MGSTLTTIIEKLISETLGKAKISLTSTQMAAILKDSELLEKLIAAIENAVTSMAAEINSVRIAIDEKNAPVVSVADQLDNDISAYNNIFEQLNEIKSYYNSIISED